MILGGDGFWSSFGSHQYGKLRCHSVGASADAIKGMMDCLNNAKFNTIIFR